MRFALLGAPLAIGLGGCYWTATYSDLIDGPRDAQPDVQVAPFCAAGDAGPLAYCMDFDGVEASSLPLTTGSADAGIVSGATLAPPSPPSALLVSASGNGAFGSYSVDFPASEPVGTVTLDLQMRALEVGGGFTAVNIGITADDFRVLNVSVGADGEYQIQELEKLPDGGVMIDGHSDDATGPQADGDWHRLVLTLSVAASGGGTSSLTVDDAVIEKDHPLGLSWVPGTAEITIGTTYVVSGPTEVAFDSVRATLTSTTP